MTEPLLTVKDVAAGLRCGKDTAYALVASGAISSVRISERLIRITPQALADYVARCESGGESGGEDKGATGLQLPMARNGERRAERTRHPAA